MRDQRQVTRQQVLHKRYEARRRAEDAIDAALSAKTAAQYAQAVKDGVKAAHDYEVWSRVLPSL